MEEFNIDGCISLWAGVIRTAIADYEKTGCGKALEFLQGRTRWSKTIFRMVNLEPSSIERLLSQIKPKKKQIRTINKKGR